ncbi:SWIM zinc finger family protein, partial [Nonomuraea sp. NPDC003201]
MTPEVVAAAVESLTSRLRKKLDAAIEQYAALPVTAGGEGLRIACGEDAVVTLSPGPSGVIADGDQASCSCLLAPRCLHRAAVLSACPIGDALPGGEEATSRGSSDAEPALAGSDGAQAAEGVFLRDQPQIGNVGRLPNRAFLLVRRRGHRPGA